jgi:hypothetical protein
MASWEPNTQHPALRRLQACPNKWAEAAVNARIVWNCINQSSGVFSGTR